MTHNGLIHLEPEFPHGIPGVPEGRIREVRDIVTTPYIIGATNGTLRVADRILRKGITAAVPELLPTGIGTEGIKRIVDWIVGTTITSIRAIEHHRKQLGNDNER